MTRKYTNNSAIIFDDHTIFAEAFALVLERLDYFVSVSTTDKEPGLRKLLMGMKDGPLYLFLDYYIPDCNVIHLMADIRKIFPEAKVIMLSSLTNDTLLRQVMARKPAALMSKAAKVSEIVACLAAIEKKEVYISPDLKEILQRESSPEEDVNFTAKEIEVLQYIAQGKSIQQTADVLHISRNTVIAHRRNMMVKVNCHSVTKLLAYGIETGLVLTGK